MEKKEKYFNLDKFREEMEKWEEKFKEGKSEVHKEFKKQRDNIADFVREAEVEAKKVGKDGSERLEQLKKEVEELLALLEMDFDIAFDKFGDNPKKVSSSLKSFEQTLKKIFEEVEEETEKVRDKFKEDYQRALHRFEIEMLIQQIYFEFNRRRTKEEYEEWKNGMQSNLKDIRNKFELRAKETEEKFDRFNDEMAEAYVHIKKAFRNLFS